MGSVWKLARSLRALLLVKCAFGRAVVVVVMAMGGGGGGQRGKGGSGGEEG